MAVAAENKGTMDMFLTRALERVQQDAYRKAPLRDACTDTLGTVSAAASPSSSTTCCTAAVCHCLTRACLVAIPSFAELVKRMGIKATAAGDASSAYV